MNIIHFFVGFQNDIVFYIEITGFLELDKSGIKFTVSVFQKILSKSRCKSLLITSKDILKIIGKKIKTARIAKKYTQEYVAEHINVSTDLFRNIENGRNIGSLPTLLNICNLLDVSPNDLFYELIDKKETHIDTTLLHYFQEFSEKERDVFKKIIIHLDKNY